VASVVLTYGQPLQEAPKDIRDQLMDNFYVLCQILMKKCF